jgi:carbamoyl-phosphate synthase large subunit
MGPAHNNVLVTCGGKWVGMLLRVRHAMSSVPLLSGGRVYVADMAPVTPAGCFADGNEVVPAVSAPDYVDRILEVCAARRIRVVLPLIDMDLERLCEHQDRFKAVGASLVCPPAEIFELCLDKMQFQRFAERLECHPPRVFCDGEIQSAPYPLFFKRRRGFGSIGAGVAHTPGEAWRALARDATLIFQEVVRGPEVSVDAVISLSGRCVLRVLRLRERVVGGEAWRSVTIESKSISRVADSVIRELGRRGLRGPLNLQLFGGDRPRIVEVNARLGSAAVLSDFASSGRLLQAVLAGACGVVCEGEPDDYRVGVGLIRFLGDVYYDHEGVRGVVPGDDRLVIESNPFRSG